MPHSYDGRNICVGILMCFSFLFLEFSFAHLLMFRICKEAVLDDLIYCRRIVSFFLFLSCILFHKTVAAKLETLAVPPHAWPTR